MFGCILVFVCCLFVSLVCSELCYVIMFYDELVKYLLGFQYFDFVDLQVFKGGSLWWMESGSFDMLNFFVNCGMLISMIQVVLIYEIFGFQLLDELFIEYGYLVCYIEKVLDNSWVCFYIDLWVCFSDGVVVIVEDVKFFFDSLVEQGSLFWCVYYKEVCELVVEDCLCICFDFCYVGNCELLLVLVQFYVLFRYWWQGCDFNCSSMQLLLGSGFYWLEKVEVGCLVSYWCNFDWWVCDLLVGCGLYNFEWICFDYYCDSGVVLQVFKVGQVDINVEISVKVWSSGYDLLVLCDGWLCQESFFYLYLVSFQGLVFNLCWLLFEDCWVCQVLSLLFDFEWIN